MYVHSAIIMAYGIKRSIIVDFYYITNRAQAHLKFLFYE